MACSSCGSNPNVQCDECTPAPEEDQWELNVLEVDPDDYNLEQAVAIGWEPFSVTHNHEGAFMRVWLRRKKR